MSLAMQFENTLIHANVGNIDMSNTAEPILTIENLCVSFEGSSRRELAVAVDGISLKLFPGEMLAIVGESGCGKSVTAMSILKLLPTPPAIVSGSVLF